MCKNIQILRGLHYRAEEELVRRGVANSTPVQITAQEIQALAWALDAVRQRRQKNAVETINGVLSSILLGIATAACILVAMR